MRRQHHTRRLKEAALGRFRQTEISCSQAFRICVMALLVIGTALVPFAVGPVAAQDQDLPNHPMLVNPNEHSVFYTGLPPGQSRVWKERVFPNGMGNTTALCLENLPIQQIFPAAGPAVGGGVFCFGDLTIVGAHEFAAMGFYSGQLRGQARQLLEFPTCRILVAGASTPIPGVATLTSSLTSTPRQHVFTCSDESGTSIKGDFLAPGIEEGADAVEDLLWDIGSGQIYGGGGGVGLSCNCDPVVCTPCCATCPEE